MITIGLGKIITDNDLYYLDFLNFVTNYADPCAEITVDRNEDIIRTVITPSSELFRQDIIDCIIKMHRILHIKMDFAKSTKIQKKIYYKINL